MNNDAYAAALAELEEGRLDKGAWARALAESGGDDSKAKAYYIKARAEALNDSPAWPDTQPPVEDAPKHHTKSASAPTISLSEQTQLYEPALGENNLGYYLAKFQAFDDKGTGLHASWNWAAFFFTGFWALYRKMYVWFFAWWFIATVGVVFQKLPNSVIQLFVSLVTLACLLGFSAYANSLYHHKIKKRIADAQKANSDAVLVNRRLSSGSGVNTWAAYVFGAIPVLGIVAAVALPAYQEYAKRQTVAVGAAQVPVTTEKPISSGVNDSPAQEVITANPFSDPNFGKNEASTLQVHLVCKDEQIDLTANVSFWRDGGILNYQHASVFLRDGREDRVGGTAHISESPTQLRVEYENPKTGFKQTTILDRNSGRLLEFSVEPGQTSMTSNWQCVSVKPKM